MSSENPSSDTFWTQHDADVIACRKCPRLVAWREEVALTKRRAFRDEEYWGRPVPGFGDHQAEILVIGLAPGAHGSNRTGRMFTGDASGEFLYSHLFRAGLASAPVSKDRDDDLTLRHLYITALCRCVPPDNKPTPSEIENCHDYLVAEYARLSVKGVIALGRMAYDQVLRLIYPDCRLVELTPFSHGAFIPAEPSIPWILASYHPSRQNTQTGKLTGEMFQSIWDQAADLIKEE